MLSGVEEMVKAVGGTYGPRGRTVMLERVGGILSTKDGVAVAWEVEPEHQLKRLGTRVVQEACDKVNRACGDGTTSTAILVHAILQESLKWVAAGAHPSLLADDLRRVAEDLEEAGLWDLCEPIPLEDEDLMLEVAKAASNHDHEAAKAIVEAFGLVGSEGMIVVEEGKGRGVEVIHKAGMEFERGYESSDLAGSDGSPRQFDIALVALVDAELLTMKDVAPILEEDTQFPYPLVVISRGCFGEALKVLVANDRKLERADGGKLEVIAVRAPGHSDFMRSRLEDLAALSGATIVGDVANPLSSFTSEMFGSVQTATVGKDSTNLVAFEDKYDLIEHRVEELQHEVQRASSSHDIENLHSRIARLTDGMCVMRVGGWSDAEIRERRGRIEDALNAVRVAVEGGVVPGGGMAYLILGNFLEKTLRFTSFVPQFAVAGLGEKVLVEALRAPLKTLAKNAGHEPSVVLERVLRASQGPSDTHPFPSWKTGWDAMTNEVRDLRQNPMICDPFEVVKAAILTSISTAATLLTAEVALTRVG